jgi:hypothetical protein
VRERIQVGKEENNNTKNRQGEGRRRNKKKRKGTQQHWRAAIAAGIRQCLVELWWSVVV